LKKIVVFSGAGISAESGLKTFRDSDGLWENYDITEVATPEAWTANPKLVLDFYNLRRKQVIEASPNQSHSSLVDLENKFNVKIITQNIDDLHERAGSSSILHLHGEILKSRSVIDENEKFSIKGFELNFGDTCKNNHQLRPDVVWFGEAVPNMLEAIKICEAADILIIIGTSLNVYPAANIIDYVSGDCKKYIVDPKDVSTGNIKNITVVKENASTGVPILVKELLQNH
jgi:NAD-dependent protein deacetylase/lipoamidase